MLLSKLRGYESTFIVMVPSDLQNFIPCVIPHSLAGQNVRSDTCQERHHKLPMTRNR